MAGKPKQLFALLKDTGLQWSDDNALRLSAALSYYTVFSLPPLLLIIIAIAGAVFGQAAAQGQLVSKLGGMIGGQTAALLQTMIANASKSGTGTIATIAGIITLLAGASGVFTELQQSMNAIWNIRVKPEAGIRYKIRKRLFSFSMIVVIGFLLLVSLVISAAITAFGNMLNNLWSGPPVLHYVLHVANFLVSFGVITVLFALIFKMLPDASIAWRDVWLGAAVSALLFTIGKLLIGLYLGRSSMASAYGAAGSLVLILAWIYYSSLIVFFGAEFTQVYANRYGSRITPNEYSESIEKKAA